MQSYFQSARRPCNLVNLDPAAEDIQYEAAVDVRNLIGLDDVAEELDFGPNGGLVFCMEHLCENLEWLHSEFDAVGSSDDEYFIVDCPGQIELFTHLPVMKKIVNAFLSWNIHVCAVYLIDVLFIDDPAKYISGAMMALSAMIQLEVPHVNVISKCDLRDRASGTLNVSGSESAIGDDHQDSQEVEDYLVPDTLKLRGLVDTIHASASDSFKQLHNAICTLLDDYTMVNFVALNIKSEESIELVLSHVDNAMNYGEDLEPMEPRFDEADDERLARIQSAFEQN